MTLPLNTSRYFAVMPAAGSGSRLGAAQPKQYLDLAGRPMIVRTAEALLAAPWLERLVIVVAPQDRQAEQLLTKLPRSSVVPEGGATRRDSVIAGLRALRRHFAAADEDWVLVHDAARPALGPELLERLSGALTGDAVGGLLAVPVGDTVKRFSEGKLETLSREGLWLAQTPQMFRFGVLLDALVRFPDVTDEASAIERAGLVPKLVPGTRGNFKVTTPDDLEAMRRAFGAAENPMQQDAAERSGGARCASKAASAGLRIGQGYDVHALVPGRPLVIGGVTIAHRHGLLGHSDADVLLHALTDALLGAAGLGDIGRHFPDSDPRFSGADSRALLAEAHARVKAAGYRIVNLDATVIAQAPRLAPHIEAMKASIASALDLDIACVNIKAKTNERLGFTGRGEGIAAEAVALIEGQAG
jgi:2-C-methyl-D-erythritol 4-phosphate cytidylyltransferase/2-C-methyl-D-erythritol 2,4-cyclodiphosphate synthase